MNSQQDIFCNAMEELEEALESKVSFFAGFILIRKDTVLHLLDKLYGVIPDAITEAESLLKRREAFQNEAQQHAEKIIADAQLEANRILSESDLLRAVQREADKIKEQVVAECEEIKRTALDEAERLRSQASDEALRTRDGSFVYADQVLTSIEQNLNQLQEVVKNGQVQLERYRAETEAANSGYSNQRQEFAENFKMR